MNDKIPADKVRAILDEWERIKEHADWDDIDSLVQDVRALLPAPPTPTLADMTPEEREKCKWMQADTSRWGHAVIICPDVGDGRAALLDGWGHVDYEPHSKVTPRPDLPRMEWPGDRKPAPAPSLPDGWRLADHKKHGRVIVTTTPNRDGNVYFTAPTDGHMGYGCHFCTPDELTYIDQEADTADTVPPNTLAVGSVWDDADALTRACEETGRDQITVTDNRGIVGVWDTGLQCWRASSPNADFAPFTIIHAGKKADQ